MRSAILFWCAVIALSLSGCTDRAVIEQASLQDQSFLAPTRKPIDASINELNSNSSSSGDAAVCGRGPSGVYYFEYEGLVGSVTVKSKSFSVSIPSGDVLSDIGYYMYDCTVFVPDYSNYQVVAAANRRGTTTAELNKDLSITYSVRDDTFSVIYPPTTSLKLTKGQ